MRHFRPGILPRIFFPDIIFRVKDAGKSLFLTFDDGPDPVSTPVILDILEEYNIKAVFFCRGDKAKKYPGLLDEITGRGHITGNHGYSHTDGWKSSLNRYLEDIERAAGLTSSRLLRPPYGRITPLQYLQLRKKYRIVLWDLMPYDFDRTYGHGRSLALLKKMIRPGSVIVLHDTADSTAPLFLRNFILSSMNQGYSFGNADHILK